jgi:hypothetical protein
MGDRFLFVTTPDGGKPAPYRVVELATALIGNAHLKIDDRSGGSKRPSMSTL